MDPTETLTAPETQQAAPVVETPALSAPGVVPSDAFAALKQQLRAGQMGEPGNPAAAPVALPAPAPAAVATPVVVNPTPAADPFLSRLSELSAGSINTPEELSAALTEYKTLSGQKKQYDETVRFRALLDEPEKLAAYSRLMKTDFQDRQKVDDKDVLKMAFVRDNEDLGPEGAEVEFERHYAKNYPALKAEYADESDPDYKADLALRTRDSNKAREGMDGYKEEQRLKFSAPDPAADTAAGASPEAVQAHLTGVDAALADFKNYAVPFGEKGSEQTFNFDVKPELAEKLKDFMAAPWQKLQDLFTPAGPDGAPVIDYQALRKIGLAIYGFDTAVSAAATTAFSRSESQVLRELANTQPAQTPAVTPGTVDDRAGLLAAAGSASRVRYNSNL